MNELLHLLGRVLAVCIKRNEKVLSLNNGDIPLTGEQQLGLAACTQIFVQQRVNV